MIGSERPAEAESERELLTCGGGRRLCGYHHMYSRQARRIERAGAWEDRFPDTIRTRSVGEAVGIVIEEQL